MKNLKLISILLFGVLILFSFNAQTKTLSPHNVANGFYGLTGFDLSKVQKQLYSEGLIKFNQYKTTVNNNLKLLVKKINTATK